MTERPHGYADIPPGSGMIDLDLFSGARGWEATSADLVNTVGIELDIDACATSEAAGFRTLLADVAAVDPRELLDHLIDEAVRLLLGSPPCQPFSAAGNGSGRAVLDLIIQAIKAIGAGYWPADLLESTGDVRTGLVVQPLRYALTLRPEAIAWEQVPAVLPVWEAAADVLRAEGYSVATGVLNAEQYGVPQTRRRAVLIASRIRAVELPRPTHSRYYPNNPRRLDEGVAKWVSMAESLGCGATHRPAMTVTDGDPKIVAVKNMGRGMVERYGHRPGRSLDEPAFTIRASAGGTEPGGFRWSDGENTRKMTLAEAATLQTFPASYPFQGGKSATFTQVGNAVPPLLGRAIIAAALGVAA